MLKSGFCSPRRGYHHGSLRDALIEAARGLVADKGPGGLTLVDAARLCGVSPAAPYRHFRDLDALLDALAGRGFALFGERLTSAGTATHSREAVLPALGAAYLAFAREEPGYYGAMFGRKAGARAAPTSDTGAFATLLAGVAGAGLPEGVDIRLVALHIWALSHGGATLFAHSETDWGISAQAVLDIGVAIYLRGVANGPKAKA
jgi:AcrR family transcriptional regulator